MCGNTNKDFNHRSKIRLLDPSRYPIPHTQGWARKRAYPLQGPIRAKTPKEGGGRQQGVSDDEEMNVFIPHLLSSHHRTLRDVTD